MRRLKLLPGHIRKPGQELGPSVGAAVEVPWATGGEDTGTVPEVSKVPSGYAVHRGCGVTWHPRGNAGRWKWTGVTPKMLSPLPPHRMWATPHFGALVTNWQAAVTKSAGPPWGWPREGVLWCHQASPAEGHLG